MKFNENTFYKTLPNISLLLGLFTINVWLILISLILTLAFKISLDYFTLSNKEDLEKKIQELESDITALKFQKVFKQ